jgi:hypothetical protein
MDHLVTGTAGIPTAQMRHQLIVAVAHNHRSASFGSEELWEIPKTASNIQHVSAKICPQLTIDPGVVFDGTAECLERGGKEASHLA